MLETIFVRFDIGEWNNLSYEVTCSTLVAIAPNQGEQTFPCGYCVRRSPFYRGVPRTPAGASEMLPKSCRNRRTGLLLRATAYTRFAGALGGGRASLPALHLRQSQFQPTISQRIVSHSRRIPPVCHKAERQTCHRVKATPAAEACMLVSDCC